MFGDNFRLFRKLAGIKRDTTLYLKPLPTISIPEVAGRKTQQCFDECVCVGEFTSRLPQYQPPQPESKLQVREISYYARIEQVISMFLGIEEGDSCSLSEGLVNRGCVMTLRLKLGETLVCITTACRQIFFQ